MKRLFAAMLLSTGLATPALAQDEALSTFTGFHAELIGGVDLMSGPDETQDTGNDDWKSGLAYGANVGYDIGLGSAVVGVEGEFTDSSTERCFAHVVEQGDRACLGVGRDLYVGIRAGAKIGPNTLIYGKAGYTNSTVSLNYEGADPAVTVTDEQIDDAIDLPDLDGARFGGGVEFAISAHAFVKGEYRWSHYERGIDRHQAVFGVGLRF